MNKAPERLERVLFMLCIFVAALLALWAVERSGEQRRAHQAEEILNAR